jgi:predicted Zn-dependent protease with MMP-like domain
MERAGGESGRRIFCNLAAPDTGIHGRTSCAGTAATPSFSSDPIEPGKAVAELKKPLAWQRSWPHLTRRRRLYFRASRPCTPEEFETAAQAIWDGLPSRFRESLGNVSVAVTDFADAETLQAMRIRNPYGLLGLYHGASLPFKSVWTPVALPDRIFLYRLPILDYARRNGQRVERVIRHVLIHEIGHHFGFSDADMAQIEAGS